MPKKQQEETRRLLVHTKLYANDSTEPFAVEGDEIDAGILDEATIEWLLKGGLGEWVGE